MLAPPAIALVVLDVLSWTSDAGWVQEASGYIVDGVIFGFVGLLAVQALERTPEADQDRWSDGARSSSDRASALPPGAA